MSPKNPSSLDRYAELQPLIRKEAEDIARRVFDEQAKKLRFSAFDIPNHTHNGLDSPRINQKDIHPGVSASGSIRMITSGQRYTLGLTFNPTQLLLYGNAVHRTGGNIDIRAQIIGNANFGKSYYFRPQSANSVKSGGTYHNVIQSGSYIAVAQSATSSASLPTVSYTAQNTGDTITPSSMSGIFTGTAIRLVTNTASGISTGQIYYAITVTGTTFQVSLTPGGSAVAITGNGNGTLTIVGDPQTITTTLSSTASATEGHLVQVIYGGNIVAEATIPNTSTVSFAGGTYTNQGYGAGFVYVDVYLASGWEINANFVVM